MDLLDWLNSIVGPQSEHTLKQNLRMGPANAHLSKQAQSEAACGKPAQRVVKSETSFRSEEYTSKRFEPIVSPISMEFARSVAVAEAASI